VDDDGWRRCNKLTVQIAQAGSNSSWQESTGHILAMVTAACGYEHEHEQYDDTNVACVMVCRGGQDSMDISADLTELGRTPVAVVCAGAKSVSECVDTCRQQSLIRSCVTAKQQACLRRHRVCPLCTLLLMDRVGASGISLCGSRRFYVVVRENGNGTCTRAQQLRI
jgi:hypothetical protein